MTDPRHTHPYRALVRQVRREEGACWLCGQQIDRALPYRDPTTRRVNPLSWTLDHVVPVDEAPQLALVRSNCRAAHHRCNSARGKRSPHRSKPIDVLITSRRW
jgi:5-methylcytosine-specific restriction endonuclease McrA